MQTECFFLIYLSSNIRNMLQERMLKHQKCHFHGVGLTRLLCCVSALQSDWRTWGLTLNAFNHQWEARRQNKKARTLISLLSSSWRTDVWIFDLLCNCVLVQKTEITNLPFGTKGSRVNLHLTFKDKLSKLNSQFFHGLPLSNRYIQLQLSKNTRTRIFCL